MSDYLKGTDDALDSWTQRRAGDFKYRSLAPFNIGQTSYRSDALFKAISLMESLGLNVLNAQVLDTGSGQGTGLYPFLNAGFRVDQLHGIEQMAKRVSEARKYLPGLDVQQGDAAKMPYADGTFDVVSEQFCFCHIPDDSIKPKIASEMVRVLKPGGFIMVMDWRLTDLPNDHGISTGRHSNGCESFSSCPSWVESQRSFGRSLAGH